MPDVNYAEMARARLTHACGRMNVLLDECNRYLASGPFSIERELFHLGPVPCVRFRYRVSAAPALSLSLLAGEIFHQLRATLDNLAWALGQVYPAANVKAKNIRLAFPVAETVEDFEKLLAKNPDYLGIREFPPAAQSAILDAQPFRRALDGPNLAVLHDLWNGDKHRVPSIFLAHSSGVSQDLDLRQPAFLSMGEIADGVVFCEGALPPQGIADGAAPQLTGVALCIRDPGNNAKYPFLPLLYGHIQLVSNVLNGVAPLLST